MSGLKCHFNCNELRSISSLFFSESISPCRIWEMLQLFRWGVQLFLVFFGVPIVFFSRYDIQGLERWCISNALFPSVFPTCNARRRRPCPCRRNSSPRRRWDLDIISGRAAGTNPSARRKCLVARPRNWAREKGSILCASRNHPTTTTNPIVSASLWHESRGFGTHYVTLATGYYIVIQSCPGIV